MRRLAAIAIVILALATLVACGSTIKTRRTSLVTVTVGSDHVAMIEVRDATAWARIMLFAQRLISAQQAVAGVPSAVLSLKVTVTASDMDTITATAGVAGMAEASLVIEVPNGVQRHFAVEGLDAQGVALYQGSVDADLDGTPVTLTVSMNLAADAIAPTVLSTVPAANAASVPINTTVSVLFSETVDANTVTTSTFLLKDSGGGAVAGSVLATGATATFTPSANLAYGALYTAEVTTAVADLAGNKLASAYTWSFTTASDSVAPIFAGASAISAPTYTTMQLSWSPATDNVTSSGNMVYLIYQATAPGGENYAAPSYATSAGATSYTVSGLVPGTPYYFVVRAKDAAGNIETNTVEQTTVFPGKYVNALSGSDGNPCTLAAPCLTISYANGLVAPNQGLFVSAGTYTLYSGITVTTGAVLACNGASNTTVIVNALTGGSMITGSQGSFIDGCKITDQTTTTSPVIADSLGDTGVINCILQGSNSQTGVSFTKNSRLQNSTIAGFTFNTAGDGVLIAGGSSVVSSSTLTANSRGINVTMGAQAPTPTITGNTITNNDGGIVVTSGTPTISSNVIRANANAGITVNSGSPLITGNTIDLNSVGISGNTGPFTMTITNNTVNSNTSFGISISGSTGATATINNNSIYCNGQSTGADLFSTAMDPINAASNAWDHDATTTPAGPTTMAPTCGGGVDICYTGTLTYSPVLTAVPSPPACR